MPSKNIIKVYVNNSYYHVYNRGVEKRRIYIDEQDYKVFLSYLKDYLIPPKKPDKINVTFQGVTFKGIPKSLKNYNSEIELICFCLMPNHFHLLIKQTNTTSMQKFVKSLLTRYSIYFNKKYNRVGQLFQSTYKAVLIKEDNYLLHLSRYIHLNPLETSSDILNTYSSYKYFLGMNKASWIKPKFILNYFSNTNLQPFIRVYNSYQKFVEDYNLDSNTILGKLTIDQE